MMCATKMCMILMCKTNHAPRINHVTRTNYVYIKNNVSGQMMYIVQEKCYVGEMMFRTNDMQDKSVHHFHVKDSDAEDR